VYENCKYYHRCPGILDPLVEIEDEEVVRSVARYLRKQCL